MLHCHAIWSCNLWGLRNNFNLSEAGRNRLLGMYFGCSVDVTAPVMVIVFLKICFQKKSNSIIGRQKSTVTFTLSQMVQPCFGGFFLSTSCYWSYYKYCNAPYNFQMRRERWRCHEDAHYPALSWCLPFLLCSITANFLSHKWYLAGRDKVGYFISATPVFQEQNSTRGSGWWKDGLERKIYRMRQGVVGVKSCIVGTLGSGGW